VRSGRNARRSGTRPEYASLVVIAGALALGILGAVIVASRLPWTAIPVGRWAFFVAGAVVMAVGIALRVWSVVVLGRSFTVEVRVRDGQQVVDRGPYRVVRHPSYAALLLVCLGIGLALGSWLALVIAVIVPLAGVIYRIRIEEAALLAGIGEPYRRYSERRSRLIPRIW
jgi:protein-S-isoprenylcysteine O-methyltransferase Ste14